MKDLSQSQYLGILHIIILNLPNSSCLILQAYSNTNNDVEWLRQ